MKNDTNKNTINPIQLAILTKLTTSEGIRYAQIRPPEIENDLFNYHLQYLLKRGLIEKFRNLYKISHQGKQLTANFDALGKIKDLFRASVALYVVQKTGNKKQLLMQRRLRHPFYGDITTVAGKIHWGEKVTDAARRKLEEETGLTAKFRFIGILRKIKRDNKDRIMEDVLYHSCYAENPTGELVEQNEFGENFWVYFKLIPEQYKRNADVSKFDIEVIKRIEKRDFKMFYFEEDRIFKGY